MVTLLQSESGEAELIGELRSLVHEQQPDFGKIGRIIGLLERPEMGTQYIKGCLEYIDYEELENGFLMSQRERLGSLMNKDVKTVGSVWGNDYYSRRMYVILRKDTKGRFTSFHVCPVLIVEKLLYPNTQGHLEFYNRTRYFVKYITNDESGERFPGPFDDYDEYVIGRPIYKSGWSRSDVSENFRGMKILLAKNVFDLERENVKIRDEFKELLKEYGIT